MSNHKCCVKQNKTYQVKQRYIPTYVHQQIFEDGPLRPYSSRCTPTFHSTVFNTDGYNVKTIHVRNQKQQSQPIQNTSKVVYLNGTQQKRVDDLNPKNQGFSASRDRWFDHTKQQIFTNLKDCVNHGYSKQRKYVDLSSDLVFTDFEYENKAGKKSPQDKCCQCCKGKCQYACQHQSNNVKQLINGPQILDRKVAEIKESQKISQPAVEVERNPLENEQLKQKVEKQNQVKIDQSKPSEKSNNLKLKGKQVKVRPQSVKPVKAVQQKPTFTVIRRNRVLCA